MARHPYQNLPDHAFWKQSIEDVDPSLVDPVVAAKFKLKPTDSIVTAGSCFAQHIARHLASQGYNYLVTETAHPALAHMDVAAYGYGVYSARYGNLYTARQALQLLRRAYGEFTPLEDHWRDRDAFVDPFRPVIQPGGFTSLNELLADRERHLAAVRRAIESMDVFVFTLGLTEAWENRQDGSIYPLCPGVRGGVFSDEAYRFRNFTAGEVAEDLEKVVSFIAARNPTARIIVTVSPVPLVATMEDRSVLVSTTYSKAALRVAAEQVQAAHGHVAYFPSYEVITGGYSRGRYFASDLRSVTEEGVSHVMRLFLKHYTEAGSTQAPAAAPAREAAPPAAANDIAEAVAVICEEEALGKVG